MGLSLVKVETLNVHYAIKHSVNTPFFSIVTICHNAGATIARTINSVKNQCFRDFEYIVVDGGSKDGTIEIIRSLTGPDDIVISEPDRGISHAFNKGIELSNGEFVFLVSADDWLQPNALHDIAYHIARAKYADVYFGNVMLETRSGHLWEIHPDKSMESIYRGPPLKHGACIVRKTAYQRFGGYSETYRFAMDYEFTFRLFQGMAVFQYVPVVMAVIAEGGINQRLRSETRRECFDIALKYGVPRWQAQWVLTEKTIRDYARNLFNRLGFLPVIRQLRYGTDHTGTK